jgi:hypothetical protein
MGDRLGTLCAVGTSIFFSFGMIFFTYQSFYQAKASFFLSALQDQDNLIISLAQPAFKR